MRYRREYIAGGCYFFTVVTARRRRLLAHPEALSLLRDALRHVRRHHAFQIDAMVVLPDHLHCIWTLPRDDDDFSLRWQLIKRYYHKHTAAEKPCWQKRFWEHHILDDADYRNHVDYIHYNPVRHGYVLQPGQWPHSSFRRFVRRGFYTPDWGGADPRIPPGVGRE